MAAVARPTHQLARTEQITLAAWGFAIALATLGTAILFGASVGINWGVWIACAVAALFTLVRDRYGAVGAPTFAAGCWSVVLALGVGVTTDGSRIALLGAATLALLALALASTGERSLNALRPAAAFHAPFAALGIVIAGLAGEMRGTVRGVRSPLVASAVRTALITLPLAAGLVLLLAEADPLFAAIRDGIEHIAPIDFIPQSIFFAVLLGGSLGVLGGVYRHEARADLPAPLEAPTIASIERRTLLGALATIMWLFVTSAIVSLFHNPAAKAGSGITYAEYVHRGFAELSVAATIVIGAVMLTRRSWVATDAWARRLAFAAITGEMGMIATAFLRIVRYEQAYGFTVLRLYAQGYMVILACASALLLWEIVRREHSSLFAYHTASAALAVLALCVFWNTDAFIVRQNVNRYVATRKIDVDYLTTELSADATPELIASLPRLAPSEHAALTRWLCAENDRKRERDTRWFAWKLRESQALAARRAWYRASNPNCTPPS